MSSTISNEERRNYELFRDCLATALVEKISVPETKPRRRTKAKAQKKKKKKKTVSPSSHDKLLLDEEDHNGNSQKPNLTAQPTILGNEPGDNIAPPDSNQDDLADFTDYIATETFACLPTRLKTVDYHDYMASPTLRNQYTLPLTGADIHLHFPHLLDPGISDSLCSGPANGLTCKMYLFSTRKA